MAIDSDSADDEFNKPVLPIASTKGKLDMCSLADSGDKYLAQVRMELKHIPKVVVANYNHEKGSSNVYSEPVGCELTPAPHGFVAPLFWQKRQVKMFGKLRRRFAECFDEFKRQGRGSMILPEQDEEDLWCRLCYGSAYALQLDFDVGHSTPSEANGPTPMITCEPQSAGHDVCQDPEDTVCEAPKDETEREQLERMLKAAGDSGTPPGLTLLCSLGQPRVQTLLEYHVAWVQARNEVQEGPLTAAEGCWLHSLMTCIALPLCADTVFCLRDLARLCSQMRTKLQTPYCDAHIRLNLVLCLVSRYFEQKDFLEQ